MFGDWKCDCTSRALVDSALAGSQAFASFFSAPMSFPASGKAATTTTTQKPTTSHLVQLPAGIAAIFCALLMDSPNPAVSPVSPVPAAACLIVHIYATMCARHRARVGNITHAVGRASCARHRSEEH